MRVPHTARILPVALLLLAGCVTARPAPKETPGAPAASVAVERFLQLAAAKDYSEMGWVFGTANGPIIKRDPPGEVERRMYALATVLQHERFEVRSEAPVPGRQGAAIELDVHLVNRGRQYNVPFTAVRGPDQRWFVEQIGLEAVTGER